MDIGRAFSYFMDDQDWLKKILIGGLISFLPILGFAGTGYWLTQTKRVYHGQEIPLPEWSDFGGYFMKGLMTTVGTLLYLLPALLIACCAFLPTFFLGNSRDGGNIATLLMFCGACLVVLYAIALAVFLPAVTTRYAITEQFGAFFQFGEAWQLIRSNTSGYFTAVLVMMVAGMIAGTVGSIACLVGSAFTGVWASLVGAHLFGNFARGSAEQSPAMA